LHIIVRRTRAFWSNCVYGRWTFSRSTEALMPTQLKARTYALLFALVGALAATGGSFSMR